jgi:hypothetical protein
LFGTGRRPTASNCRDSIIYCELSAIEKGYDTQNANDRDYSATKTSAENVQSGGLTGCVILPSLHEVVKQTGHQKHDDAEKQKQNSENKKHNNSP